MTTGRGAIAVRGVAAALTSVMVLGAGGCATYKPLGLPAGPDEIAAPQRLTVDTARLRLQPLRSIRIDAADGLDPLAIAVLAVLNSPALAAQRRAAHVADAQVFAAGLLPDPQITTGMDKPLSGPDHHTASNLGVGLDLAGLLAKSQARRAADLTARQADLNLLWAEWGVAQQARQLAETVLADEARADVLRQVVALAAERDVRSEQALAARDATLQTTAADLAVKLDAQSQLMAAEHDAQKARRDLNALLDLRADVTLPLAPAPPSEGYDAAAVQRALGSLAMRRPDLLALQAGYQAQDANLRKAILAQFPLNTLAAAYARDPAGTSTIGGALTLILPIFDGGRGEARVQSATREQLHAEYQARLDQADAEARNAERERVDARKAAAVLQLDVPRLQALTRPALEAYERRDIDSQTYLALSQTLLSKTADLDDKSLAARLAEIALETALFLPPAESRDPQ